MEHITKYRFERLYSYTNPSAAEIKHQLIQNNQILDKTLSIIKGNTYESTENILFLNDDQQLKQHIIRHFSTFNKDTQTVRKISIDSRLITHLYTSAHKTDIGKTWKRIQTRDTRNKKYGYAIIHPAITALFDTIDQIFPHLINQVTENINKYITIIDFNLDLKNFLRLKENVNYTIR